MRLLLTALAFVCGIGSAHSQSLSDEDLARRGDNSEPGFLIFLLMVS